jgi:hypothetical protein
LSCVERLRPAGDDREDEVGRPHIAFVLADVADGDGRWRSLRGADSKSKRGDAGRCSERDDEPALTETGRDAEGAVVARHEESPSSHPLTAQADATSVGVLEAESQADTPVARIAVPLG